MPRKQPKSMSAREKSELLDELWRSVALLKTKEEVENFFHDLLSDTEAIMLARRIRIARLLLEGRSYNYIHEKMGVSDGTIASVHNWLQDSNKGYEKVLPKLEKELERKRSQLKSNKSSKQPEPYSFEWARRRYPLHFLLFNLLEADPKSAQTRSKRRK